MLHSVSPCLTTYQPGGSTCAPAVSQLREAVFSLLALRWARASAAMRARSRRRSARDIGALPRSTVVGSPALGGSAAFLGSAAFFDASGFLGSAAFFGSSFGVPWATLGCSAF